MKKDLWIRLIVLDIVTCFLSGFIYIALNMTHRPTMQPFFLWVCFLSIVAFPILVIIKLLKFVFGK